MRLICILIYFQGKGDVLTYWLLNEDKMKRLTRLESYMSDKHSPTSYGNNNLDCNNCDSVLKCDTTCEYSFPSSFDSDSDCRQAHSNRPPFKRQVNSEQLEETPPSYENCITEVPTKHVNSVVPLEVNHLSELGQRRCENHIEMTPLLSER